MRNLLVAALFLISSVAFSAEKKLTVFLHARAYVLGEIILVEVSGPVDAKDLEGSFLGQKIAFFPGAGSSALGFAAIDLDAPIGPAKLDVKSKDGSAWEEEVPVQKKIFPVSRLKVDPKYVELSKADEERVEREQKQLSDIFKAVSTTRFFDGDFQSPLPGARHYGFGKRRILNGVSKRPHSGADFETKAGTPVKATASGRVVLAEDTFFLGNSVILDHGFGLMSYYAHLSRMDVKVGELVTQGAILGAVGNTGRTTGPTLHWGVKLYDLRVDPFSLTALRLKALL